MLHHRVSGREGGDQPQRRRLWGRAHPAHGAQVPGVSAPRRRGLRLLLPGEQREDFVLGRARLGDPGARNARAEPRRAAAAPAADPPAELLQPAAPGRAQLLPLGAAEPVPGTPLPR